MTVMEQRGAYRPTPPPAWQPRTDPAPLLPDALPYRVLGTDAAADADPALLHGSTPSWCAAAATTRRPRP